MTPNIYFDTIEAELSIGVVHIDYFLNLLDFDVDIFTIDGQLAEAYDYEIINEARHAVYELYAFEAGYLGDDYETDI